MPLECLSVFPAISSASYVSVCLYLSKNGFVISMLQCHSPNGGGSGNHCFINFNMCDLRNYRKINLITMLQCHSPNGVGFHIFTSLNMFCIIHMLDVMEFLGSNIT